MDRVWWHVSAGRDRITTVREVVDMCSMRYKGESTNTRFMILPFLQQPCRVCACSFVTWVPYTQPMTQGPAISVRGGPLLKRQSLTSLLAHSQSWEKVHTFVTPARVMSMLQQLFVRVVHAHQMYACQCYRAVSFDFSEGDWDMGC